MNVPERIKKETRRIALGRAIVDKGHLEVFWQCLCGYEDVTRVEAAINKYRCPDCKRWMQWSYKPFENVKK